MPSSGSLASEHTSINKQLQARRSSTISGSAIENGDRAPQGLGAARNARTKKSTASNTAGLPDDGADVDRLTEAFEFLLQHRDEQICDLKEHIEGLQEELAEAQEGTNAKVAGLVQKNARLFRRADELSMEVRASQHENRELVVRNLRLQNCLKESQGLIEELQSRLRAQIAVVAQYAGTPRSVQAETTSAEKRTQNNGDSPDGVLDAEHANASPESTTSTVAADFESPRHVSKTFGRIGKAKRCASAEEQLSPAFPPDCSSQARQLTPITETGSAFEKWPASDKSSNSSSAEATNPTMPELVSTGGDSEMPKPDLSPRSAYLSTVRSPAEQTAPLQLYGSEDVEQMPVASPLPVSPSLPETIATAIARKKIAATPAHAHATPPLSDAPSSSRPRRSSAPRAQLVEPSLNRKLRRGDEHTFGAAGNAAHSEAAAAKTKKDTKKERAFQPSKRNQQMTLSNLPATKAKSLALQRTSSVSLSSSPTFSPRAHQISGSARKSTSASTPNEGKRGQAGLQEKAAAPKANVSKTDDHEKNNWASSTHLEAVQANKSLRSLFQKL